MSEIEYKEKAREGEHAARVLNDPLVQKALEGMRTTVYENIRSSHFKQVEEREDLYKMLRAIDSFERQFKDQINGGKKAQSRLEELLNNLKR